MVGKNCKILKLGTFAVSIAGRDKKKTVIVVGIIDDDYVAVADGKSRKISSPKKKKLKHLRFLPEVAEQIAEKIDSKTLLDADIRKAIEQLKSE